MPTFAYSGRTRGGQSVTGERVADTMDAAVAALRRRRLTESDASGFSNVLRLVLRTQPRSIEIAPQAAAEGGSISATNL